MKKEFLLELGISEEDAKKIMEQNGADIDAVDQKLRTATQERDTLTQQLQDVQTQLKAFEGVNLEALQGEVQKLGETLLQEQQAHQAKLAHMERSRETEKFLAGKAFVNEETRAYYAAQLETALDSEESRGKSREELLSGMVAGEDGTPKPGIFAEPANPNPLIIPPSGGGPEPAGMPSLKETQTQINAHRIVR